MLRWNRVIIAALIALSLPLAVHADKVKIVGGEFTFEHEPVTVGDIADAQLFSVTSETFAGQLINDNGVISFTGEGTAIGYVYEEWVDNVAAEFSGNFTWKTADGDLSGTFEMLNFPTDHPLVFGAWISLTFDGGTGRFFKAKGNAIAEGFDFPFGGLGASEDVAGVWAEFKQGELKLKE